MRLVSAHPIAVLSTLRLTGGFRTPVDYLYFKGHWGDEQYPESDERQENYFGWIGIDELWKYVGGPTGPVHKQLDREEVCPDNGIRCIIWPFLKP